jgi:methionyl-tRNA formyltransferase
LGLGKKLAAWEVLKLHLFTSNMRIVFLGTPDFAVPTLEMLVASNFNVVGVVTAPDKPAGRGLILKQSPVKEAALRLGIPVLQPERLKDPDFLKQLTQLKPDVQIVVAFRMLPEAVWNLPRLGTWNLHASLLPQYRGAAPINHAIINGESETGLTTFKLVHEIDQGAIAKQTTIKIGLNETAGDLHDRMMQLGATLMLETIKELETNSLTLIPQKEFIDGPLKEAPKLNSSFCTIDFNLTAQSVHNHIRGLSPFPGAQTKLIQDKTSLPMKIYKTRLLEFDLRAETPGTLLILNKKSMLICCQDAWIEILELQIAGKKRLLVSDFLAGFRSNPSDRFE